MFGLYFFKFNLNTTSLKRLWPPSSIQNRLVSTFYESKYNVSEENSILQILNSGDQKCLSAYAVSQPRLKRFLEYRSKNGRFTTIQEMLDVEGFGEKMLEKFCDSILKNDTDQMKDMKPNNKNEMTNRIKGQVLTPSLTPKRQEELQRVSAFHVSPSTVSWVQINRDNYSLNDWQIMDTSGQNGKRSQLPQIWEMAWSISSKVSKSDIYILEAQPVTLRAGGNDPNNPKVISVNLQKAQLTAMLVALFNAKNYQLNGSEGVESNAGINEANQCVHLLRSSLSAKLFRLLIGNEIVLAHKCIARIFGEDDYEESVYRPKINVNIDLQKFYKKQKDADKEMLGRALLLGITFMDICIYKNEEAVKSLSNYRYNN